VQELLSVILVILIILVVAIVFVPAYLERLSRRNRGRRTEYGAELKTLRRERRRLERMLTPYTNSRSAAYREAAAAAGERLRSMTGRLDEVEELLDGLRCPGVSPYLLPVQHFLLAPGEAAQILADARNLGRARAALAAATASAAETDAALEALAALPERLAAERTALARRLTEVEAAVDRERQEGIEALDDLTRHTGRMRGLLAGGERAAAPDANLTSRDDAAVALESAAAGLAELEARVAATAGERAALDQHLGRAVAELDNAQATTKSGPGAADAPAQVRPLLRRAASLLNESAPAHRRRREFAAARGDVDAAVRLISLGRDLAAAERGARLLEERDDGGLGEAIAGLRRELGELAEALGRESEGPAGAAMAGRAAGARARADALVRQQDEAIAELEREALAARGQLERAWEAGRHLLLLADDDPLARRYARLLDEFGAARRRPAALEAFRRDAAAFEGVLAPWVTRVQAARQLIDRLRTRLPELIDAARTAAAPWNCLAEHVTYIQQRAADFKTAQGRFAKVRYRREAEVLMDELAAIEGDVEERYSLLSDAANRLHFLAEDVRQIVDLASADLEDGAADTPDRQRRERGLRLIAHHMTQAHAATRYEDASLALLRAADAANKLAL
jgi:hypothetical protein